MTMTKADHEALLTRARRLAQELPPVPRPEADRSLEEIAASAEQVEALLVEADADVASLTAERDEALRMMAIARDESRWLEAYGREQQRADALQRELDAYRAQVGLERAAADAAERQAHIDRLNFDTANRELDALKAQTPDPGFVSCECPAWRGNPCPLTHEQCSQRVALRRLELIGEAQTPGSGAPAVGSGGQPRAEVQGTHDGLTLYGCPACHQSFYAPPPPPPAARETPGLVQEIERAFEDEAFAYDVALTLAAHYEQAWQAERQSLVARAEQLERERDVRRRTEAELIRLSPVCVDCGHEECHHEGHPLAAGDVGACSEFHCAADIERVEAIQCLHSLTTEHAALKARVEGLVEQWRAEAKAMVPADYASRGLHRKYLKLDNYAAGMDDCADELADIIAEKGTTA